MPTPGSAPSKAVKRGSLAVPTHNSKDPAATVSRPTSRGSLVGSDAGFARADRSRESAATMAPLGNSGEDLWLKEHIGPTPSGGHRGDRSSGERRVAFGTRSRHSKQDLEFANSHSSQTLSTKHGGPPTDGMEHKIPPLGVRVRNRIRTSGPDGRQATRRHHSQICQGSSAAIAAAIGLPGTPGGESPSSQTPTPARRLLGLGGASDKQDGDREQAKGGNLISRTSSPARLAAMRQPPSVPQHSVSVAAAALDGDAKYQASLMVEWKRDLACDSKPDVVQTKQLGQFFDFLFDSSKEGLLPGASRYIKEACGDIDSLEVEMRRGQPEIDPSEALEFTSKQKDLLRTTLKRFAQASSPRARCNEVLYRPTFCRFLIDSGLVSLEDHTQNATGYHEAVRLFDAIARSSADAIEKGMSISFGAVRFATVDQCMMVVSYLLGRQAAANGQLSNGEVWNNFEYGLLSAQQTVQAIINEGKRRATAATAKLGEIDLSDEAFNRRRKEVYGTHGSPPQFFSGSLREWSRGLKYWVETSLTSCSQEFFTDHAHHNFAAECYVRDMLLEPGCIHVCMKFGSLFKTLYEAYRDDTLERVHDESYCCAERDALPHMSFACFFRFCVDFGVFPHLCSFDEAWAAYRSSDCLVPVCDPESSVPDRFHRAVKRMPIFSMLGSRKHGENLSSSGRSTSTSESEQEESDREENEADAEAGRVLTESRTHILPQPQPQEPPQSRATSKTFIRDSKEAPRATSKTEARDSKESVPSKDSHAPPKRNKSISMSPEESGNIRNVATSSEVSPARFATSGNIQVPAPAVGEQRGSKRRTARIAKEIIHDIMAHGDREGTSNDGIDRGSHGGASRRNSEAQSEGSQATDAQPRVKTSCDFAFIKKTFSTMSQKELNHYSVLSALNDCVTDRFIQIRGLVKASGHQTKQGFVDVDGFRGILELMRITHPFMDDSDMEDFFSAVDPNAPSTLGVDGRLMLDAAELEKAVNCVRQDLKKRGLLDKSSSPGNPTGGRAHLGEAARRLSNKVVRFGGPNSGELRAAFGHAAFTESLVLLGIQHMHSDGTEIKGAAPGGVKGLWLVSFLHSRFDELIKEQHAKRATAHREVGKTASRLPLSISRTLSRDIPIKREIHDFPRPLPLSEASTRPPTRDRENSRPSTRDAARDAPFSQSAAWTGGMEPPGLACGEKNRKDGSSTLVDMENSVLGGVQKRTGFATLKASSFSNMGKLLVERSETEQEHETEKEKAPGMPSLLLECNRPPKRANYTSFLTGLLDDHPDVFMRALSAAHMTVPVFPGRAAGRVDGDLDRRPAVLERPQFGFETALTHSVCEVCGKGLDEMGLGTVFCHQCSGVDSRPIKDSILYPVFERRRFRLELRELRNRADPACSEGSRN